VTKLFWGEKVLHSVRWVIVWVIRFFSIPTKESNKSVVVAAASLINKQQQQQQQQ